MFFSYSHHCNGKYHSYKGEVGKIADNILKRAFTAEKPFEKLTTDVTEFKVCNDKVYLSPVLDLFNREIVSYSISLSPNLQQIRDMLTGLFAKLPDTARPIFHSDQGWPYQHAEYQRLLAEHNITQSMSRKGNCMDNGAMENFFGRLKVEMFYRCLRTQWMKENKPHGFAVSDVRIGGVMTRLFHCAERLDEYVAGDVDHIEELEEELLDVRTPLSPDYGKRKYLNYWDRNARQHCDIVTANMLFKPRTC